MYSDSCSLHIPSVGPLCGTWGPDPDPHLCIWLRPLTGYLPLNTYFFDGGNPHRLREHANSTRKCPPYPGIDPRTFLL